MQSQPRAQSEMVLTVKVGESKTMKGLVTPLFVKVPRPGHSEMTFSVFE